MSLHQMPGNLQRGQTRTQIPTGHGLGTYVLFPDADADGYKLTNELVVHRIVKNNSGGALLPSRVVKWEDGQIGKQVDGSPAANGIPAGIVDPFLPAAGVPNGSYFLLVVKGMCNAYGDGTPTQNGPLGVAASGKIKLNGQTAAELFAACGVANVDGGSDGDIIRVFFTAPQTNV